MINEFYVCDAIVTANSKKYSLLGINLDNSLINTVIKEFDTTEELIGYCFKYKIHIVQFNY